MSPHSNPHPRPPTSPYVSTLRALTTKSCGSGDVAVASPDMPTDEQATYPSGLARHLPERRGREVRIWGEDLALEMGAQPLGAIASCINPECIRSVTFSRTSHSQFYCSHHCRTRASRMRARATQQLQVIEGALADPHRGLHGLPRAQLRTRAAHLRWWLTRLSPSSFEVDE